jgi:hypothetical protein
VLAALALLTMGCASHDGDPPSGADVPLPPGVTAEMGVDGGGRFYLFSSTLEPDLALAAYAITLEQAGYSPAGTERGWALFTGERGTIAVRAEPGPPTLVLVRPLFAPDDAPPAEDPVQTATSPLPEAGADPEPPGAGSGVGAGSPGASPGPAPAATPAARPGRRPDPPHGSQSGIGDGNGQDQGQGDGQGDGGGQNEPGGQGQGQGQGQGNGQGGDAPEVDPAAQGSGEKPDATPRPTKTPRP